MTNLTGMHSEQSECVNSRTIGTAAADNRAAENRDEGGALDQRVAGRQLLAAQMV